MKSQKNIIVRSTLMVALLLSFSLNSCKKSDEAVIQGGPVRLIVNMLGVEDADEPLALANGGAPAKLASVGQKMGHTVYSQAIQETIVPFDDKRSLVATLVPRSLSATSGTSASLNRLSATRPEAMAVTGPVQTDLTPGVWYRILVYNSAGTRIGQYDFKRGTESPETAITGLVAGQAYTFVTYSMGRSDAVGGNLAASTLSGTRIYSSSVSPSGAPAPFMMSKTSMTMNDGDNFLNIVLKNIFSEITTRIELDDSDFSPSVNIMGISGVTIGLSFKGASYWFSNGQVVYTINDPLDVPLVFPAIGSTGTRSLESNPIAYIMPDPSNGGYVYADKNIVLTIGSLTIGTVTSTGGVTVTRSNIQLGGIIILPGHKYNLNIKIQNN